MEAVSRLFDVVDHLALAERRFQLPSMQHAEVQVSSGQRGVPNRYLPLRSALWPRASSACGNRLHPSMGIHAPPGCTYLGT